MAELSRANGVPVRDITVKVNVTPDEYFALCHLADSDGRSQSSFMRQLLRERIVDAAYSASDHDVESMPTIGQKRA